MLAATGIPPHKGCLETLKNILVPLAFLMQLLKFIRFLNWSYIIDVTPQSLRLPKEAGETCFPLVSQECLWDSQNCTGYFCCPWKPPSSLSEVPVTDSTAHFGHRTQKIPAWSDLKVSFLKSMQDARSGKPPLAMPSYVWCLWAATMTCLARHP